ncbi:60S ribosomal protein L5 [Talaromyces proteolyticus]|uniref:60S ribosomal protein L5 n=1 Tax=Talaromyces proteolyticus TaxID=1131652 RepID=A0AAD4KTD1_9EURO|nr:60S ribosomal protein L5 [Talaromyces proteolyticus]KAH8698440.1 60S ribosomal protein L5 [Talaromyces proteolyticus]
MASTTRPRVLLFDVGGVCVVSPFQAILDYEIANNVPPGWVNFSISRTSPNGSWHKLERGEIAMNAEFFKSFNQDLQQPTLWKEFHQRLRAKKSAANTTSSSSISDPLPALPKIDAEYLFWEMMRISREPDPFMFPALKKLKASGKFIMGALSNTVVFPPGHQYEKDTIGLRKQFDFFVSSAHSGLRKPDPKIYAYALDRMNELASHRGEAEIEPSDVIFLDDIGENLKGAKKAGFGTLKVVLSRTQDAVRELEHRTAPDNRQDGEFFLIAMQLQHCSCAHFTPHEILLKSTRAFHKLVKNSAYYSRYQTKYKRRREGKTDYYARKRLITQAKNKYSAKKYRLVVRFTNRDIITQVVYSEITGDKVIAAAYSHELKRYGIEHGLTNWSAAYATGLLLARRLLKKLELDDTFEGVEEADGEFTLTEAAETDEGTRRPFKVFLDVGLVRTSTGARVFGALKGASDGGLFVPHSENRFPGFDIESEELDADTLRKYITGGHVAEYMEALADDDEERFKSQFSEYIDNEVDAGDLEDIYLEAHKAIREDPLKKDENEGPKKSKEEWKAESKKYRTTKLSHAEKAARVQEKIRELAA